MPIHDSDVDSLLARAARTPDLERSADAALTELTLGTRAAAHRVRRRRRALIATFGAIAVVGGVTAGAVVVDHWLQQPPFQGLPDGWVRTTSWVPIEWVAADGEESKCRTYVDLERTTPEQLAAIDAALAGHDWAGMGQRLYERLPTGLSGEDVEAEVIQAAIPRISDVMTEALPTLNSGGNSPATGAFATTCIPDLP